MQKYTLANKIIIVKHNNCFNFNINKKHFVKVFWLKLNYNLLIKQSILKA